MTRTWDETRPIGTTEACVLSIGGPEREVRRAHRPRHRAVSTWRATARTAAYSLSGLVFVALGVWAMVAAIADPSILR